MADLIWRFFHDGGFQPHGFCLMWRPEIFWTHVAADLLTAVAYFSIPLALLTLARRRPDVRYGWMLSLFGLFIVACGVTHLFGVWTMWVPSYGAEAVAKGVTAAASLGTAAALWPLMPRLIAMPSRRELEDKNARLAAEIASREEVEAALRRLNDELERRVAERTRDLERSNAELRRATEARRALLDTMVEGVIGYDADGAVTYFNDAARRLLAAPPDRPPALARGASTPPSPAARVLAGETVDGDEASIAKGDGSGTATFRFMGAPICDADGRIAGAVVTFTDVTAEKAGEERRRLLAGELDHRVRNMLATISSMIQVSRASAPTPDALAEALVGRVGALARAHGQLTGSGWRGASLRRVLVDETAPFAGDGRLSLEGEADATLTPKDASDLALAVHELATNAVKHGAWRGPEGRVVLTWRLAADRDPPEAEVVWREEGGPTVRPPTRRGFGGTLLGAVFGGARGGGVDLRYEPDGVVCVLRTPALPSGPEAPEPRPSPGAAPSDRPLSGRRILLVEDERLVGIDMARRFEEAGAIVSGPAVTPEEALALLGEGRVDAAVLDVNLGGHRVTAVAEALRARSVPFVFVSGYADLSLLPAELRAAPLVHKPADPSLVVDRIAALLARPVSR
jgi:two-component sensor histidine kinase